MFVYLLISHRKKVSLACPVFWSCKHSSVVEENVSELQSIHTGARNKYTKAMKAWLCKLKNKHKNIAARKITFCRVLFFSKRQCVVTVWPAQKTFLGYGASVFELTQAAKKTDYKDGKWQSNIKGTYRLRTDHFQNMSQIKLVIKLKLAHMYVFKF